MLITMEEIVRAQARHEVMHQTDVARLVQRLPFWQQAQTRQYAFGLFVPRFG